MPSGSIWLAEPWSDACAYLHQVGEEVVLPHQVWQHEYFPRTEGAFGCKNGYITTNPFFLLEETILKRECDNLSVSNSSSQIRSNFCIKSIMFTLSWSYKYYLLLSQSIIPTMIAFPFLKFFSEDNTSFFCVFFFVPVDNYFQILQQPHSTIIHLVQSYQINFFKLVFLTLSILELQAV